LAGRVRILKLLPFSQAELEGGPSTELEGWFNGVTTSGPASLTRNDYIDRLCAGGYPEPPRLPTELRPEWFESYLETVTQRDVVALAQVRSADALPRLAQWVAATSGAELNTSRTSRDLGISRETVSSYLEWLRMVFLVREAQPWSRNQTSRASKRSKLYVTDTGLAAGILNVDASALRAPTSPMVGPLLETFVSNEMSASSPPPPCGCPNFTIGTTMATRWMSFSNDRTGHW
jgi:predicted AAA+ superfamily ATPase